MTGVQTCALPISSYIVLELRPLRSTGITRRRHYCGPLRHPKRPDLALAGCRLWVTRPHRRGFPCCLSIPLSRMPSSLPRWDRLGKLLVPIRDSSSRRRPSPLSRRLGSHITLFEACSTFTRVTACVLADSPKEAFSWSASADLVTSFHRPKCYWQEQLVARRGSHPLKSTSLSRHTE